jgi:hypothetical protein
MQGGELNAPLLQGIPNGSYSVLAYKGNTSPVSLAGIAVSNGVAAALAPYAGYMFVLGASPTKAGLPRHRGADGRRGRGHHQGNGAPLRRQRRQAA